MNVLYGRRQHKFEYMRSACLLLLCLALIAPKLSLAILGVAGSGGNSAIICTGSGLARVTLSPSGEVIDDATEYWTSAHCVLVLDGTENLERAWHRVAFGERVPPIWHALLALSQPLSDSLAEPSNRGPPGLLPSQLV